MSNNLVHMFPGFHAQAGCEFHAYIVQENCSSGHAPEYYENPEETDQNYNVVENANQNPIIDEEKAIETSFTIVPNPNSGSFSLFISGPIEEGAIVSLFDLSGKIQFEGFTQNNQLLNLNLASGVYLVQLTIANQQKQQKLVVQ